MGVLWRLFAPRPLKKARRAMHPSWVIEDAIVRGVRGKRKRRRKQSQRRQGTSRQARPAARPVALYTADIRDTDTGRNWCCDHDHGTREAADRCADAMEKRINRLGWVQATGSAPVPKAPQGATVPPGSLKRPQRFQATLTLPDGSTGNCCRAGHPTSDEARRHREQLAAELRDAYRGYGQVNYPTTKSAVVLDGTETLAVVGELHYQGNLWELVGGRGGPEQSVRKPIIALLHPETDNLYDANAISVWVSTREDRARTLKAGHLSRDDARRYRPGLIAKAQELGKPIALRGVIMGGGMREDGPGRLGVFLDHEPADFGLPGFAQ